MSTEQEALEVPEPTPTTEPVEDPRSAIELAAAALEPEEPAEDDDPRVTKANREAAKYRRELRETQEQLGQMQTRIDAVDRTAIERAAADAKLVSTEDLWLATDLTALRGEDGILDESLVAAHLEGLSESRPHWFAKSWGAPAGPRGLRPGQEPEDFDTAARRALGVK